MNYKIYFENNKVSRCEAVKDMNDIADYAMINNKRIIKSLVVNAMSEKDAVVVAERLAKKLSTL